MTQILDKEIWFNRIDLTSKRININGGQLSYLRFAHDVILFAENGTSRKKVEKSRAKSKHVPKTRKYNN